MLRVHSFAVAFNYLILAYLRLIYTQFWRHFLTAFIILSTWLYNYYYYYYYLLQVQLFQISDFTNHYANIKITGYRVLYSESIVGRGVAILICWSATAGQVDCFNRVFKEYIDFSIFIGRVQTTLSFVPETRHTTNLFTRVITLVTFLLQLIIHFHSWSKPPWSYQK